MGQRSAQQPVLRRLEPNGGRQPLDALIYDEVADSGDGANGKSEWNTGEIPTTKTDDKGQHVSPLSSLAGSDTVSAKEEAMSSSNTEDNNDNNSENNELEIVGPNHDDERGHNGKSTSSSQSSSTTMTAETNGPDWKGTGMDILVAVFFVFAAVWLILAVGYSVILLVLLRLQSQGELDIYDEDLGLLNCCGGRIKLRFGWILRRYAIQMENDHHRRLQRQRQRELARNRRDGNDDDEDVNYTDDDENLTPAPIRIMTREERRKAVEELLSTSNKSVDIEKGNDMCSPKKTEELNDQDEMTETLSESRSLPCESDDDNVVEESNEDANSVAPDIQCECRSPASCGTKTSNGSQEGPVCSICLDGYESDDVIFRSPTCPHRFHRDCIMDWLERCNHIECPCCRETMVSNEEIWDIVKRKRKDRRRQLRQENSLANRFVRWLLANRPRSEDDGDER